MEESFKPLKKLAVLHQSAELGQLQTLPPSKLCQNCRTAIVKLSSAERPLDQKTRQVGHVLGSLGDLRERVECDLCQLVAEGVDRFCTPSLGYAIASEEPVSLSTSLNEFDPRVYIRASKLTLGSIHEISTILPQQPMVSGTVASCEADSHLRSTPCNCCFLPKRLCQKSASLIDFNAVRTWVQWCVADHPRCADNVRGFSNFPGGRSYPSTLIDVSRQCLVVADASARYCALSYVYGKCDIFRATKDRFQELQETGALGREWVHLPAAIRDAMALVDAIGERYLWTDSLCIMFDDPVDVKAQISHMSVIYGNSHLTICVISGSNANESIPGVQPNSRSPLPQLKLWGKGIFFCPNPVHQQMLGSVYESRAWTFQERVLSPRNLYITDSGVYFQCSENFFLELNWPMLELEPHELFNAFGQLDSPDINPLIAAPKGTQIKSKHPEMNAPSPLTEWLVYFDLVRVYSQRRLTFESDALLAFAGMESVLATNYETLFYYGLPNTGDVTHLHWVPADEPSYAMFKTPTEALKRRLPRRQFPSFCWAGWQGPVEWLEAVVLPEWWQFEMCPDSEFDSSGCFKLYNATLAPLNGLAVEFCDSKVVPEQLLGEVNGYSLPLLKLFSSDGKWCGRLCDRSVDHFDNGQDQNLHLVLLSTCAARKIQIRNADTRAIEYRLPFDGQAFSTTRSDCSEARLCNLLLISGGSDNYYERRALCQIHEDVWGAMEKKMSCEIILI